jgi:GDP-L-fucose synthase
MANKILVTGSTGLVGQELQKFLPQARYVSSKDFNLMDEQEVIKMFKEVKPEKIVHLAAHVGSLNDNIVNRVAYFEDNILMNTHVLRQAYKFGVKRFLGVLSTCIYPDDIKNYPIKEEMLHTGAPHVDLYSYAYAKRCLAVQIDAYNAQNKTKFNYLIPCNMYGETCKAHAGRSHYVNALINKIIEAKKENTGKITLFGDGTPLRQFMHAQDLAKVIEQSLTNDITDSFNVATEENYSVNKIAQIALKACDAEDITIEYDPTKPNGQPRKDVSIERFRKYFPDFKFTPLNEGIKQVYQFLKR